MSDVLSSEEIARLVEAAKEGKLPDGPSNQARRSRSVRKLDFSRPMKLSLVEQKRFEQAHATFCREAAARLSNELRSSIELEVIDSEQLTWQAAFEAVPQRSIFGVARCEPGEAMALLCVEEAFVLRLIDRLLGGSPADVPPQRKLTEIDVALARRVFEDLLASLATVWRDLMGLDVVLVDLQLDRTGTDAPPAIQPTLALTIEARELGVSATMIVLVPHTVIESAGKTLGDDGASQYGWANGGEGATAPDAVGGVLGDVRVEVRAEVGAIGLTIGEVLALGEGDVVRLGAAGTAGITVGDTCLHHARPGLRGSRRAVQIVASPPTGGARVAGTSASP